MHLRAEFAIRFALFQILPFVVFHISFAHAEGDFHFSVLPIKREREKRVAFGPQRAQASFRISFL